MNLSVGIVGLPNVGKSTLFNALLNKQQALAANYPFATIEPNVGIVPVPDERLEKLAEITANEILNQVQDDKSKWPPIKPATVEFVDIAGLVKGASEGAGLGNKFLSHIREVKVIAHVVRAFEDPDIVRYEEARPLTPSRSDGERGSVSPEEDYQTIQTELLLSDLQTIENAKLKMQKSKLQLKNQNFFDEIITRMNSGVAIRDMQFSDEEQEIINNLFLLTAKPEVLVLNVAEEDYTEEKMQEVIVRYTSILDMQQEKFVVICAKIEEELAVLSEEEQREYLRDLGLEKSGLERLIQKAYDQLGLISFLTAGEKEVRAWTIQKGNNAVQAAGEIHTDFMKKFIKAEVVSYDDYVSCGGRKKARELGKARLEGKDYIVQDGDVIEFKIGS